MNKKMIAVVAVVGLALSGCSDRSNNTANREEQHTQDEIQNTLVHNQPIPFFPFSEQRNTLIAVETAEANGVATTSFFWNQGVKEPFFVCPSIGFPIASTAQLSNPKQVVYGAHPGGGSDVAVVDQMEPTGVYTGESLGTYVECVAPNGTKYAKYWEGFVDTIGGPAHWDGHTEVLDGDPTVVAKK